jgi:protein TonB
VVAIVHVVLFVACLVVPGCMRFFQKKELPSIPVEFLVDTRPPAPDSPAPIVPDNPEPPPAPDPEPEPDPIVPDPVVPEPEPVKPPEPPKPPRTRPKIVKGPRVVRKQTQPSKPRLTQQEIDRLLAAGAKPSDTTSVPNEAARGEALIHNQFHAAWKQPSYEAAGGHDAYLIVVFTANGTVKSFRLKKKSGSDLLDRSVLDAARSVPRVFGLTAAFIARRPEVTIRFHVK